jgi:hypothetical protein
VILHFGLSNPTSERRHKKGPSGYLVGGIFLLVGLAIRPVGILTSSGEGSILVVIMKSIQKCVEQFERRIVIVCAPAVWAASPVLR